MPDDLDRQASDYTARAYSDPDAAYAVGFRDGFIGNAGRAVSDGIDQQTAYFVGFREGCVHRDQVEEVVAAENLDVNQVMRKAFDFYYADRHKDQNRGCRRGPVAFWWAIHNLFAHPASEVLYWIGLRRFSFWLHDATIPVHKTGEGRG